MTDIVEANQKSVIFSFPVSSSAPTDDMDDDDIQWQEEFKVRVSSDFDRLVAFATEMNKTRETSPKREMDTGPPQMGYGDYRSHMKKDDSRKMKNEKSHDYPADLSNERRIRMMMDEQNRKSKHMEHQ